jgi:glycosyltransferase involved in cell wall biosynthesis
MSAVPIGDGECPTVAVFRSALLHGNEPYILTQAEAVPRYRCFYVGTHRTDSGIALPPDRTIALGDRYRAIDARLDRVLDVAHVGGALRAQVRSGVLTRASQIAFELLGFSPYLRNRLQAFDPALLHAHTGSNAAFVLPLVRRLGVPLVITFHGYDATASDEELQRRRIQGRVYLRRREALKREALRMIAVSGYIRDRLLEKGWPPERVTVHYMGVDTGLFRPDPAAPLAEREPIIFYAGRLIEKKGLEYLVDAMPAVQARVPEARIVVAGAGDRREPLARRAAGIGARLDFVGHQTPVQIRQWMARARLYCMPSVRAVNGDGEGLPTAIVEAMASGVPVVSTTHAGIPEAVVHGRSGLLAPERDTATLARHLVALLTDAALCARMGVAARERVLEVFDHRAQAAKLASIYDEVRAERALTAPRRMTTLLPRHPT